jgi:uncharacterized membrane protein YgaE (UPF0421/DUF939 family)
LLFVFIPLIQCAFTLAQYIPLQEQTHIHSSSFIFPSVIGFIVGSVSTLIVILYTFGKSSKDIEKKIKMELRMDNLKKMEDYVLALIKNVNDIRKHIEELNNNSPGYSEELKNISYLIADLIMDYSAYLGDSNERDSLLRFRENS